jgi:hypothetical protein
MPLAQTASMPRALRLARWLPVIVLVPALSACDHFLQVSGRVVDCSTHEPIAGATITGHDDKGLSTGQDLESVMTKTDGAFALDTAVNAGDWVTLRIAKVGYAVLDVPLHGMPDAPLALCLDAAP